MNGKIVSLWIPGELLADQDLSLIEKAILSDIAVLDKGEGCKASNEHFAKRYQMGKQQISNIINKLARKGCITTKLIYKKGTKEILYRLSKYSYIPYIKTDIYPIEEKLLDSIQVIISYIKKIGWEIESYDYNQILNWSKQFSNQEIKDAISISKRKDKTLSYAFGILKNRLDEKKKKELTEINEQEEPKELFDYDWLGENRMEMGK